MKILIGIIVFLLYSPLGFGQKSKLPMQKKHQIAFSEDRTKAIIKKNSKIVYDLSEVETNRLTYMLEAVNMKIYPNQEKMLVDYFSFLISLRKNESYINYRGVLLSDRLIDKPTLKLLQVIAVVEINRLRQEQKLPNLLFSEKLLQVAQDYADYCTKSNQEQSHFDKQGNGPAERVEKVMPGWGRRISENIFSGHTNSKQSIIAFSKSPGHLANMVDVEAQFVAIGISRHSDGRLFYVQNFIKKLKVFD